MARRLGFFSMVVAVILCGHASTGAAAVSLSSLTDPSVQTLIATGVDGVTVGPVRFFDFTFAGSSPESVPRTPSQVAVQPITTANSFGLRFLSAWFATGGGAVADVITYKLEMLNPAQAVGRIDLFSDGTAPVPLGGSFAETSLTARVNGGAVAGRILTTYDDGHTSPLDTTQPDSAVDLLVIAPQPALAVTDAIAASSGSANGSDGVAMASIVENTFTAVPEPRLVGYLAFPCALIVMALTRRTDRRRRRSRRALWQRQFGVGAAVG